MTKSKSNRGRKLGTVTERLDRVESKIDWLCGTAFQTVSDSVAEQASACQAMLRVLAELHPDRRMVKCETDDGRVFYDFKLISEIEAQNNESNDQSAAGDQGLRAVPGETVQGD